MEENKQLEATPTNGPSERQVNAVHGMSGSVFVLIYCIVATVTIVTNAIGQFGSGPLGIVLGVFGILLDTVTVVGLWLLWGIVGRKKANSTVGITMMKVPLIIRFILDVIGIAAMLVIAIIITAAAGFAAVKSGEASILVVGLLFLFIEIATLVFNILYFNSVKGLLNTGAKILKGEKPSGPTGIFAAVCIIIKALFEFAPYIFVVVGVGLLTESAYGSEIPQEILQTLEAFKAVIGVTIGMLVFAFLVRVYAAVLIILFNIRMGSKNQ